MNRATLLVLSACLTFVVTSVAAAPPPDPKAAPNTTLADDKPPPRTRMALRLAGLVTFVAGSCPQLSTDYTKFKAAIASLGVGVDDLNKEDLKAAYLGYAAQYQSDIKANCERARLRFGPKGATLPDLFSLR